VLSKPICFKQILAGSGYQRMAARVVGKAIPGATIAGTAAALRLPPHLRKEANGNTSSAEVPTIGRHGHG
jgi:hypothetical protein